MMMVVVLLVGAGSGFGGVVCGGGCGGYDCGSYVCLANALVTSNLI
jgi:hypothetical protein